MKKTAQKTIRLVGINGRFSHSCLALFYVRNELDRYSSEWNYDICQFTINDPYYEMLLRLGEDSPDYIFFSAAIWNSTLVEKLVRDLHICRPQCQTVIGGPQASVLRARLDPQVCSVVVGPIESVEHVFYRDLESGTLQETYGRSLKSSGALPYQYPYREEDFDLYLRNRSIYYESSRGCPFRCSYCLSATEKGVYHKELDAVKEELLHILSHRPKVVRFIDRTFNDLPERALALWRFLDEHGGQTLFHFEVAPDRFNQEMLDFLKTVEPGRFQFEIGIQSTNPETLEAINRRIDNESAFHNVVRLAERGNIHLHVDLILGLPYETRSSFARSFRDIFAMGAHYIQMGLLKILPDTPICHQVSEFGYLYCHEPPYSVLCTGWMDHTTLSELYRFSECVEKFVNNRYFVSLWKYLRQTGEDAYDFFYSLLSHCLQSDFFLRASTQELMCEQLVALVQGRHDHDLILELLRYDWLRCGFRFLPDCLQLGKDKEDPAATRSLLYQRLPQELPGVYNKAERNYFFRKSFFLKTSEDALEALGIHGERTECCICFLAKKEEALYGYSQVLVF